jgi:creatinine amidohydrolase
MIAMQPRLKWGECTWEEVKAAAERGALAVAPFGSTEQHGPMLPLDTDIHIAEKVALDGARVAVEQHGVDCLVMPTMPYGLALHHMRFAGTVSLMPGTYVAAIGDVLRCAVEHGFRRIAVISGHGGNRPALELGITKVVTEFADRFTLRIAMFQGHSDAEFARRSRELHQDEPSEGQPGIHAARWETSETLADRPHLVREERLHRPALKRPTVPEWRWRTHELSETGAFGDPTMARADLGERMWEVWAEAVGLFLKRLAEEPL